MYTKEARWTGDTKHYSLEKAFHFEVNLEYLQKERISLGTIDSLCHSERLYLVEIKILEIAHGVGGNCCSLDL